MATKPKPDEYGRMGNAHDGGLLEIALRRRGERGGEEKLQERLGDRLGAVAAADGTLVERGEGIEM